MTLDIYTTVPHAIRPFLFTPEMNASSAFSVFSSKFDSDDDLLSSRRLQVSEDASLSQKLASLRALSTGWVEPDLTIPKNKEAMEINFDEDDDDDDEDDEFDEKPKKLSKNKPKRPSKNASNKNKSASKNPSSKASATTPTATSKSTKPKAKRIMPRVKKETSSSSKEKPLKKIVPKKRS